MKVKSQTIKPNAQTKSMGSGDEQLDRDLNAITGWIADLPDSPPPPELLSGVMASIEPKKLSRLQRFFRWLRTPKSFTYRPLQLLPAAAAVVLILAVSLFSTRFFSPTMPMPQTARQADVKMVVFKLKLPQTSSVALIGSFNDWTPEGHHMRWDESQNAWTLTMPLERGRYEYAFLVDGQNVLPDPQALLYRDDGFGNKNSILILGNDDRHENSI